MRARLKKPKDSGEKKLLYFKAKLQLHSELLHGGTAALIRVTVVILRNDVINRAHKLALKDRRVSRLYAGLVNGNLFCDSSEGMKDTAPYNREKEN